MSRSSSIPSLWRPLCVQSAFRNLLLADVVSDIGTFMQSVGAAWLMVSLNAGPMYVALTQTELVFRYRRGILMILSRSPESRHVAADLCQDTLRIAIESIRSGDIIDPERLSGFVCGIAPNLVLNYS